MKPKEKTKKLCSENEEIGGIISVTFTDYPICEEKETIKKLPKIRVFINQEYTNEQL
jgi:hypothetical protein